MDRNGNGNHLPRQISQRRSWVRESSPVRSTPVSRVRLRAQIPGSAFIQNLPMWDSAAVDPDPVDNSSPGARSASIAYSAMNPALLSYSEMAARFRQYRRHYIPQLNTSMEYRLGMMQSFPHEMILPLSEEIMLPFTLDMRPPPILGQEEIYLLPSARHGAIPNTIELMPNLEIYACPSMDPAKFPIIKQYYTHVLNLPYSDRHKHKPQPEGSQHTATIILSEPWEIFPSLLQIIDEIIAGVAPGHSLFVYSHGHGYTNKFGQHRPATVDRSAVAVIAYLSAMLKIPASTARKALNKAFAECDFPPPRPHIGHLAQVDAYNKIEGYKDSVSWQGYEQKVKNRAYKMNSAAAQAQNRAGEDQDPGGSSSSSASVLYDPSAQGTSPPTSPEAAASSPDTSSTPTDLGTTMVPKASHKLNATAPPFQQPAVETLQRNSRDKGKGRDLSASFEHNLPPPPPPPSPTPTPTSRAMRSHSLPMGPMRDDESPLEDLAAPYGGRNAWDSMAFTSARFPLPSGWLLPAEAPTVGGPIEETSTQDDVLLVTTDLQEKDDSE